jgi:transposase-like protein
MSYAGIDYGLGRTNIDTATGIRYGVISQHSLASWFYDEWEADYGDPTCPECGCSVADTSGHGDDEYKQYTDHGCADYVCHTCKHTLDSSDVYPEYPIGHELKDRDYHAVDCLDSDVMILASPYYTYAQFCSPCVPGACNLDSALEPALGMNANRAYCFGHDYFEEQAPYRVFRVADNSEVFPEDR